MLEEEKIEDLIYGVRDSETDFHQGFLDGCISLLTSKYGEAKDFQSVYEDIVQKNYRNHVIYEFLLGKLTAFCAGGVRAKEGVKE